MSHSGAINGGCKEHLSVFTSAPFDLALRLFVCVFLVFALWPMRTAARILHHEGVKILVQEQRVKTGEKSQWVLLVTDIHTRVQRSIMLPAGVDGDFVVDGASVYYWKDQQIVRVDAGTKSKEVVLSGIPKMLDYFPCGGFALALCEGPSPREILVASGKGIEKRINLDNICFIGPDYHSATRQGNKVVFVFGDEHNIGSLFLVYDLSSQKMDCVASGRIVRFADMPIEIYDTKIVFDGKDGKIAFSVPSLPLKYFKSYGKAFFLCTSVDFVATYGVNTFGDTVEEVLKGKVEMVLSQEGPFLLEENGRIERWQENGEIVVFAPIKVQSTKE
jgi:hypothetical protein